ncbi:MAG: outer membrane protein assembly factor BamD [Paracoccaceae bacterium]|nr:outer membrane protein assembly factor BamD [Paracoccaceae bacterium]
MATLARIPGVTWLLIAALAVAGCSGDDAESVEDQPPDVLYQSARQNLDAGDFVEAAESFGEVERLYPYSDWAKRAVVMSAFAFHQAGLYDNSREAALRYLDFYPADEDAAYARYLVALSYYDQIDDVSRDQSITVNAMQALRTVVEFYPESEYATAARLKLDLTRDHLAAKEMAVGRYYMKQGQFGAAINRFRVVVEDYETTSHTPEALHRLVESYLSLGLEGDALTAAAILGHNFRGSDWYRDSYALLNDRSIDSGETGILAGGWLGDVYRRVIRGDWL